MAAPFIIQAKDNILQCLMMDNEDAWMYYHDDVVEKIDLTNVLKTSESGLQRSCFKLSNSWEAYVTELPKFPWTSMYLTSLELEGLSEIVEAEQLQDRIMYATYYGPNGLKWKDFSDRDNAENIEPVQ
ncbi:hypothetical protein OS493_013729 [Desmophyllum pertusum]|uniref:Uncharacterized protein n=1 Tax=Desmophyllum pertusum TaxID=174260 RepID=A0A9W9ZQ11_9CNID|nr:hypothetical protein OS493_013729 [Desmophyllum pertusum]